LAAGTPRLSIESLGRRFDDRTVVTALDLTLAPGERVALTGANGSGKSTVLRCVAGALSPTTGQIHVDGHPSGSLPARAALGASFTQDRSFYLRLSGRRNLAFFARVRVGSARRADRMVDEVIDDLELGVIASERVDRCSTGMVQQLGLARALLANPKLLILDEPTRSMDEAAVERLWGAVSRRPRMALLIATHRNDDLDRCHAQVDLPA
jgi:ABC-type multidrug transport system ATPase subunit